MSSPQSGWYPDPARADQLRLWDGNQWTEQTRPAPNANAKDATQIAPAPTGTPRRADDHGFAYASIGARTQGLGLDAIILFPIQAIVSAFICLQLGWSFSVKFDPLDPNMSDNLTKSLIDSTMLPLTVFAIVTFVTFAIYYQVGLARYGTTLGGRRARIQCVNKEGARASHGAVLVRYLVWGLPTLWVSLPQMPLEWSTIGWVALAVNYGWALFDSRRQALMDRLSGTYVIAS